MEACDLPLVSDSLGNNLGQFKDELEGDVIISSQFFAPKYYTYTTKKGKTVKKIKGINMATIKTNTELFDGSIYNDYLFEGRQAKIGVPQMQWKRQKLSVFTSAIIKELVLIPRRNVKEDGTTEPFESEEIYNQYRGKNIYQNEANLFYYK